jgi:hypothetical protein
MAGAFSFLLAVGMQPIICRWNRLGEAMQTKVICFFNSTTLWRWWIQGGDQLQSLISTKSYLSSTRKQFFSIIHAWYRQALLYNKVWYYVDFISNDRDNFVWSLFVCGVLLTSYLNHVHRFPMKYLFRQWSTLAFLWFPTSQATLFKIWQQWGGVLYCC